DERMMQELGRLGAADQPRELHLTACGGEGVVAADYERHALYVVVHGRRELIRPVPVAIAQQQIAALLRRPLRLRTVAAIDEALPARLRGQRRSGAVGDVREPFPGGPEPHAKSEAGAFRQAEVRASAGIAELI